jgi:nitrite reductase/ring-hydroxylating ferredoxin subunit/uncharacterized membrane protein
MVLRAQTQVEDVLVRNPAIDQQIDRVGEAIQGVLRNYFDQPNRRPLANFLHGVWLGHPLHAAITDLPVGAWTCAQIFDYIGAITGNRYAKSAGDMATGAGVVGGIAAAAAGLADYSQIAGEQRRYGTVHGILNALGLIAFSWSLLRRMSGDRAGAIPLSTLGYLLTFISADLGGTMVYRYGTAVNRQFDRQGSTDFTPVLAENELGERQLKQVQANGIDVVLVRSNGNIYAMGNTCTHEGCSLANGMVLDGSIKCRCHGSQFALASGAVMNGPATSPEPSFDVRVVNGQIEVRERPY